MATILRSIFVSVCMIFLVLSLGCQTRERGNIPRTAPVSGTVTLDGKPVAGAGVVFVPTGTPAYGAYAMTDSAGRFTLKCSETVKGAVPGNYLVQVTKVVPVTDNSQTVTAEEAEHEAQIKRRFSSESDETKNVLPEKYASAKTSGIEVTVPAEGIRNLKIELTSQ